MGVSTRLAATLAAGIVIGAGAVQALHAQAEKKPAYVYAELEVTDPAGFQAYAAKVPATLAPYHAKVIVRGKGEAKEGAPPAGSVVMLAFDSLADAERWYSTPPYSELIPERQRAAKSRVFIIEGLPQ